MKYFSVSALDQQGKQITESVKADDVAQVQEKLKNRNLMILNILPVEKEDIPSDSSAFFSTLKIQAEDFLGRMGIQRERTLFFRQLSTLLGAGIPLVQSLRDIIDQLEHQWFKRILTDIYTKINEGAALSNAMGEYPQVFQPFHINMARVGENLGSLDEVMHRLADAEEKKNQLGSRIRAALWYPLFMLFFAVSVLIFLLTTVVPRIAEMFLEQNKKLPLPTEIVIGVSSFLTSYWIAVVILILGGIIFFQRYRSTEEGRKKLDNLKLTMPLFKGLYLKTITFKFVSNLGVLLKNNVELTRSFEIVENIVDNSIIRDHIAQARKKIIEGSAVSTALISENFLPRMVTGMIAAGESGDKLDDMLLNISKVYENEIDVTVKALTALIEPIIIIIMGITIGGIVISVMLPIMEINTLVQ